MHFVKVLFSKMALEKIINTQNPLRSWEVKGSSGAKKWEKKKQFSPNYSGTISRTRLTNDGATQMQPVYSCPVPSDKIGERVWALWRPGADPLTQFYLGEGAAGWYCVFAEKFIYKASFFQFGVLFLRKWMQCFVCVFICGMRCEKTKITYRHFLVSTYCWLIC